MGTGTDQITIKDWFANAGGINQIEQFQFADGTTWSNVQVNNAIATPPTGQDKALTTAEDSSYQLSAADFGFASPIAGNSLSAVRIETLPTAGTLRLSGNQVAAGSVITSAALNAGSLVFTPAAHGNGTGYATLSFSVKDATGVFDSTPNALTFNVTPVNDAPTGGVTLSGTATQNQTLSVANTLADADGLGTLGYQWQSSTNGTTWVAIGGATANTFTLGAAQVGLRVRAQVSYTDAQGTAESVASNATAAVLGAINQITGTTGADNLTGTTGADQTQGLAGNDTYTVNNVGDIVVDALNGGTDKVQSSISYTLGNNVENLTLTGTNAINGTGNSLNNVLTGNSAANVLDGGAGADSLVGGAGNDTYWLGRGYGIDTVTENDATANNADIARFHTGIATDQLWFAKSGNHLNVSIIGTNDRFTLTNWYLGSQYRVEQLQTSDGKVLLGSQVQNLVSAMAGFAPPPVGQTTLSTSQAASLTPVIAANWQ